METPKDKNTVSLHNLTYCCIQQKEESLGHNIWPKTTNKQKFEKELLVWFMVVCTII